MEKLIKYVARFERTFECEVMAKDIKEAQTLARFALKEFPEGTCRMVSLKRDGYVDPPDAPAPTPVKPRNKPPGGSPGTPIVRQEVLVDQIAEAA